MLMGNECTSIFCQWFSECEEIIWNYRKCTGITEECQFGINLKTGGAKGSQVYLLYWVLSSEANRYISNTNFMTLIWFSSNYVLNYKDRSIWRLKWYNTNASWYLTFLELSVGPVHWMCSAALIHITKCW